MKLTLQTNKSDVFIKNYENHKIYINDKVFENNIMIINSNITKWEITSLKISTHEYYKEILMAKPEIVIIGTGTKLIMPDNKLIHEIHKKTWNFTRCLGSRGVSSRVLGSMTARGLRKQTIL